MARSSARLRLPTIAKKRTRYEERTGAGSRAASILFRGFNEAPAFIEDEDGNAVRQWKPEELKHYTNDDMRRALSRRRAVELHEMLEHVPPRAIGYMTTKRWIEKDPRGGFYHVTRKAWLDLRLPARDREGRKIRFYDGI